MENKELTPSESLALIANVITEAKSKFRDNEFSFIFLGICISLASFGQFILLQTGLGKYSYFPYFILPVAGIITFFYYRNKLRNFPNTNNPLSNIFKWLGMIIGINTMFIGFFFWKSFGTALFPVMFILVGLWCFISGVGVRFKPFIYAGLFINISGFVLFFIPFSYHPLVLSLVIMIGVVMPGILLNLSKKQSHV